MDKNENKQDTIKYEEYGNISLATFAIISILTVIGLGLLFILFLICGTFFVMEVLK